MSQSETFTEINVSANAPEQAAESTLQPNEDRTSESGDPAIEIPNSVTVEVPANAVEASSDTAQVEMEAATRDTVPTLPDNLIRVR